MIAPADAASFDVREIYYAYLAYKEHPAESYDRERDHVTRPIFRLASEMARKSALLPANKGDPCTRSDFN